MQLGFSLFLFCFEKHSKMHIIKWENRQIGLYILGLHQNKKTSMSQTNMSQETKETRQNGRKYFHPSHK